MDELLTLQDERDEDELEELGLGSTAVRTAEGWETTDYMPPGDDWLELADGSFCSPDGTMRTWPLTGPEPQ